jgi:serine/threonine-protein kinase
MGLVLAARHVELDTRVAIKTILPEMQRVPGMVSLLAREAKATTAIRSEHVAQVYDVGTDEQLGPYIVMEYLEGRDLGAVLALQGRLPVAQAIDYVLQACEALAAAHAKGVIHRDIKPANLFLTRQGELEIIKLLDFGVSKAALTGRLFGGELATETVAGVMGTPLYMSPEQIHSSDQVDERADIWSLGAVLYELVTGHSAFNAADDLPVLLSTIGEIAPAPLAAHDAELQFLQGVIDQCLDEKPGCRFQNVAELAYALLPFASPRSQLHAHRAAAILGTRVAAEAVRQPAQGGPRPSRGSSGVTRLRPPPAVAPALLDETRCFRSQNRSSTAPRSLLLGALLVGALLLGPGSPGSAGWASSNARSLDSEQVSGALELVPSAPPAAPMPLLQSQPSATPLAAHLPERRATGDATTKAGGGAVRDRMTRHDSYCDR